MRKITSIKLPFPRRTLNLVIDGKSLDLLGNALEHNQHRSWMAKMDSETFQ